MRRSPEQIEAFLTAQAERMWLAPTSAERKLWERLWSLGFARQMPIMGETKNGGVWLYIADFLKEKLIIEVDGSSHRKKIGRDRRRDTRLVIEGYKTLRVTNQEVDQDLDGVVARIRAALHSA